MSVRSTVFVTQFEGENHGNELGTLAVALREAREESGLDVRALDDAIFDVDVHGIPAGGREPAHLHFDVRFLVQAKHDQFRVSEESHALAWVPEPASAHEAAPKERFTALPRNPSRPPGAFTVVAPYTRHMHAVGDRQPPARRETGAGTLDRGRTLANNRSGSAQGT